MIRSLNTIILAFITKYICKSISDSKINDTAMSVSLFYRSLTVGAEPGGYSKTMTTSGPPYITWELADRICGFFITTVCYNRIKRVERLQLNGYFLLMGLGERPKVQSFQTIII